MKDRATSSTERELQRAVETFGDKDRAVAWLSRAHRALGGARPVDLLGTEAGAEPVTDELGRIEYGDLF